MGECKFQSMYKELFPFWDYVSDSDKELICANTQLKTYNKGELVHDGNGCTGLFIVKEGSLRVSMVSDEGKEVTLYRLFPGDICMLSASCVIEAITFDVFIEAQEKTQCVLISGPVFAQVSNRCDKMKIFALETAVSRFSDVMWVIQQVLFMSIDKRLAIFLTDEIAKTGSNTVKMTHEQIAKNMGSAREVVSRMLKYFSSQGIVELSRGGITVIDRAKLRELTL